MKRVLVSILLLVVALLMSKSFSAELGNLTSSTPTRDEYALGENDINLQSRAAGSQLPSSAECLCNIPAGNPTFTLVLIAALMASFTMATFIYGSQFIVTLVTG